MAFAWGTADCATLFGDVVVAITGYDPIADGRGYRTELGAVRKMKAAGFNTMVELVEARFVEIPVALAHRGDLGFPAEVPEALMCPAIIDGHVAISKSPIGSVVIPRSAIARAFAV